MVRSGVNFHWKGQVIGTVGRRPVAIHSSGQTISSLAHIEGITLSAGEEIDEVAGGASGVGVHTNDIRGITIHITESKIHISYSKNHGLTLFFHYFYVSPLPTLAHIIARGSTFLISSSFDVTKFQQKKLS